MPSTKSSVTHNTSSRHTTDLRMPITNTGAPDKRYTAPQFVNADGKRDMRTTLTSERK